MGTIFYYSCSNNMVYWKTLFIGFHCNLGSCIEDVLLSGRDYV